MKNINFITLLIILTVVSVFSQEKAPPAVVDLANSEIVRLGTDPVIVAAVKAQNNQNLSLAQIQATDDTWQKTNGIDGFMESLMVSDCGKLSKQLLDTHAYYAELFVMDNPGANVAMSDKTSDYWQGDEAKFKESLS